VGYIRLIEQELRIQVNFVDKARAEMTLGKLFAEIQEVEDALQSFDYLSSPALNIYEFEMAACVYVPESSGSETSTTIRLERRSSQYYFENLANNIPLLMLFIPRGDFIMGSPEDEIDRSSTESPQHIVRVTNFFMSRYPITQAQWHFVAELPRVNRELNPDPSSFKGDERPVETVSWYDAVEFCARLARHTGRHYRLPTEAEWEYACRAMTIKPFHFGETLTSELANYEGTKAFANGPVGEYRQETTLVNFFKVANAFGLTDMHGNVWEWCLDKWYDNYEGAPIDGSAWISDTDDSFRLIRGGSWNDPPENCRSASRRALASDHRSSHVGFRIVCSNESMGE
jgi:formylglycine-generating enzyme required for sulfatase activity